MVAAGIHPTAIVSPLAKIAPGVKIGPYAVIEDGVEIGEGTVVKAHCVITGRAKIGKACRIFPGVYIGEEPQDLKYQGEDTSVEIGDRTVIHECSIIHRGTSESWVTRIGSDCLLMGATHVAHDCQIGNRVILAHGSMLSGHVIVEDNAIVGGKTGVHQFVRIGRNAMVGGMSRLTQDVLPFTLAEGYPCATIGLNSVGLKRAGMPAETRQVLKSAYRLLFRSRLPVAEAIARMKETLSPCPELEAFIRFAETMERGFCHARSDGRAK